VSRHRIRHGHHLRAVLLALSACALGAMLLAGAARAGQPTTVHCAAAGKAAKSARSKGRKPKKRRARSSCGPVTPVSGVPSPSSPPPPAPATTGGYTNSDPGSQTLDNSAGCGPAIPKSSGGTWQCTFYDNFNGSTLDSSKWLPQRTDTSGYVSGPDACYVDSPNNISVSGGTLKLTARKETAPFTCGDPRGNFTTQYTSGMVTTYNRFSQAYGRFEVRAKVPATQVKGLQSSFWLWPANPSRYGSAWPASGEIDIAEMFSEYADRAVPYIHYNAAGTDPNATNTSCLITNLDAFHTYAVEWTPASIKVIYDGHTCLVDVPNPAAPLTGNQPFDQPFIVALTQALGIGDNAFDPSSTPLPATTEVDYVRVWD
jgi:beta-glucanase (GH16 family)